MLLKEVIPLGRTLREYELMFALTESDKERKILGVGDGPASFNAEWTRLGGSVISIDPVYEFTGEQIKERFDAVIDDIIETIAKTPERWVWDFQQNPHGLRMNREAAIQRFLADYEAGKNEGRYRVGELPILPFPNQTFDLALCSHFLFLYAHLLSLDFHLMSLRELCRVATEVRVFPLVDMMGKPTEYLETIQLALGHEGITTEVLQVQYEFQKGGNQMLRLYRNEITENTEELRQD